MELDIHLNGAWHSCARATLLNPDRGMRRDGVRLQYEGEYAAEHFLARDHRALTVRVPVDFGVRTLPHWPSFLIDLLPQGAARRRIERLIDRRAEEIERLKHELRAIRVT